jgi:hypothetical protein
MHEQTDACRQRAAIVDEPYDGHRHASPGKSEEQVSRNEPAGKEKRHGAQRCDHDRDAAAPWSRRYVRAPLVGDIYEASGCGQMLEQQRQ